MGFQLHDHKGAEGAKGAKGAELLSPLARLAPLWLCLWASIACGDRAASDASSSAKAESIGVADRSPVPREPEPKQWTLKEVARRLTDGGLVVTDSGRTSLRQSFLAVEGHRLRVSGSDLQVFIYPDPRSRTADSDRLDPARAAPPDAEIDWVATPHLIASGNLIAIHLTASERLAERVRLILEAWHAGS